MPAFFDNLEWKPSTVSWLSFVLMGFIVAGIGLSGTTYVVNALQTRLMHHGIEHNREIADALLAEFDPTPQTPDEFQRASFADMIDKSNRLGFRILIIDRSTATIVADSGANDNGPVPLTRREALRASGPSIAFGAAAQFPAAIAAE